MFGPSVAETDIDMAHTHTHTNHTETNRRTQILPMHLQIDMQKKLIVMITHLYPIYMYITLMTLSNSLGKYAHLFTLRNNYK